MLLHENKKQPAAFRTEPESSFRWHNSNAWDVEIADCH